MTLAGVRCVRCLFEWAWWENNADANKGRWRASDKSLVHASGNQCSRESANGWKRRIRRRVVVVAAPGKRWTATPTVSLIVIPIIAQCAKKESACLSKHSDSVNVESAKYRVLSLNVEYLSSFYSRRVVSLYLSQSFSSYGGTRTPFSPYNERLSCTLISPVIPRRIVFRFYLR